DLLIADRLAAIVRQHGRDVYEDFDRQAAVLFQRGKDEQDPHLFEEVCREYPIARVVPEALLEVGSLYESSGRMAEASRAYKRLLTAAIDDEHRARAIWSMARVYEARKLFVAARDAYLDLLDRYPQVLLRRGDRCTSVAEV